MLSTTCHCGAVRIAIPRKPRTLTNCNCSICRRYGTLWAYYKASTVRVEAIHDGTDATADYVWGDRRLAFVRCRHCGCVMCWRRLADEPDLRMGVNARNFDPAQLGTPRIRKLDGASSWKYID